MRWLTNQGLIKPPILLLCHRFGFLRVRVSDVARIPPFLRRRGWVGASECALSVRGSEVHKRECAREVRRKETFGWTVMQGQCNVS